MYSVSRVKWHENKVTWIHIYKLNRYTRSAEKLNRYTSLLHVPSLSLNPGFVISLMHTHECKVKEGSTMSRWMNKTARNTFSCVAGILVIIWYRNNLYYIFLLVHEWVRHRWYKYQAQIPCEIIIKNLTFSMYQFTPAQISSYIQPV